VSKPKRNLLKWINGNISKAKAQDAKARCPRYDRKSYDGNSSEEP